MVGKGKTQRAGLPLWQYITVADMSALIPKFKVVRNTCTQALHCYRGERRRVGGDRKLEPAAKVLEDGLVREAQPDAHSKPRYADEDNFDVLASRVHRLVVDHDVRVVESVAQGRQRRVRRWGNHAAALELPLSCECPCRHS